MNGAPKNGNGVSRNKNVYSKEISQSSECARNIRHDYCAGKRYNPLFFIERPFWIDEIEIEIELATGKITTILMR